MKVKLISSITGVTALICAALALTAYVAGPPPGTTNAPGETTCFSSPACHNGTPNGGIGFGELTIMGGVPAGSLYIPGQTYQMMPYVVDTSKLISGFEAVALLDNSDPAGSVSISMPTTTQLIASGGYEYVMQTAAGAVEPAMSTMHDRMFNWQAPAAGSGRVTFYISFVAADGNGGATNDNVYTDTLVLYEDTAFVYQDELPAESHPDYRVFPLPATDHINVWMKGNDGPTELSIVDLSGRECLSAGIEDNGSSKTVHSIDLQDLTPGLYFVKIATQQTVHLHRILINR